MLLCHIDIDIEIIAAIIDQYNDAIKFSCHEIIFEGQLFAVPIILTWYMEMNILSDIFCESHPFSIIYQQFFEVIRYDFHSVVRYLEIIFAVRWCENIFVWNIVQIYLPHRLFIDILGQYYIIYSVIQCELAQIVTQCIYRILLYIDFISVVPYIVI
jgi:hypothetical protein